MALTDQPYLPLYINDWLSNIKLKSCSANSHGVLINIMALMHKQENYGTILLQQKYQQSKQQISNFATQFARILSFDFDEIEKGLIELIDENVLFIEGNILSNKRMIRDAEISKNRAESGSKGGKKTAKKNGKFATAKATAKNVANTDIIIITEIINYLNEKAKTKFSLKTEKTLTLIQAKLNCGFTVEDFRKVIDVKCKDWFGNPEWSKFLRPETLFGNKFEGYLNEKKEISPKEETYEERQREKARRDGIILP